MAPWDAAMHDVIVIGGGIIGLSIARELAGRKSVLLLDRSATGQGTSRAAAGMLTPLSEADDQGPFFQLSRASLAMYDRFVDELRKEPGLDVAYSQKVCSASLPLKNPLRRFAAGTNGNIKRVLTS